MSADRAPNGARVPAEWTADDGSIHRPLAHVGGAVETGLRRIQPVQKASPVAGKARPSRAKRDNRNLPAIGWMAQPRRRYVGPGWRTRDGVVRPVKVRHVSPEVMSILMSRRAGE